MLHFTIKRIFPKEHYAREFLSNTAHLGASIHRRGTSQSFIWLMPLKSPRASAKVRRFLESTFPDERFELVDVKSYGGPDGSPVLEPVEAARIDDLARPAERAPDPLLA